MGDVIDFNGLTAVDLPVNDVLDGAKDKLKTAVLVGFEDDGSLYIASTMSDIPELLMHLHCFRVHLDQYISGNRE